MSKSNPISNMNCSICDKTTETMLVDCCDRQVCSDCVSYCNQQTYANANATKKSTCNKIICNECVTHCEYKDCNDVACSDCINIRRDYNSSQCHICELFYCNHHIELCDAECGKIVCKQCKKDHENDGHIHIFPYDQYNGFLCHECFTNFDCCFNCNGDFRKCTTCDKQVCINCDHDNLIFEDETHKLYCIGCEPAEYAEDAEDDE
jgi:hypothetical protein